MENCNVCGAQMLDPQMLAAFDTAMSTLGRLPVILVVHVSTGRNVVSAPAELYSQYLSNCSKQSCSTCHHIHGVATLNRRDVVMLSAAIASRILSTVALFGAPFCRRSSMSNNVLATAYCKAG
eukprot:352965-Chlamydomonas_euryale.AAC.17